VNLFLHRGETADAGGKDGAEAGRIDADVSGLSEGLSRGRQRELLHAV
jgi:hypothetical protein